jgi:ParB-like chromosome segregation protein Spo0J
MFHPDNSQERYVYELEAIANSIKEHGFAGESILVNRWNNKIISGHGRVEVCYDHGYKGDLPVIYFDLPSEEEHRRMMLQMNRARGHQNAEKERMEIEYLLDHYGRPDLQRALAYRDDQIDALLAVGEQQSLDDLAKEHGELEERDFWPTIKVQVSPETYQAFQAAMDEIPGDDEAIKFEKLLSAVDFAALAE